MRRLRFLGQEVVPDEGDGGDDDEGAIPVLPQDHTPVPVQASSAGPALPLSGSTEVGDGASVQRVLRPRRQTTYRDKRAWTRRKMLAGFLGIPVLSDIILDKPVNMRQCEFKDIKLCQVNIKLIALG